MSTLKYACEEDWTSRLNLNQKFDLEELHEVRDRKKIKRWQFRKFRLQLEENYEIMEPYDSRKDSYLIKHRDSGICGNIALNSVDYEETPTQEGSMMMMSAFKKLKPKSEEPDLVKRNEGPGPRILEGLVDRITKGKKCTICVNRGDECKCMGSESEDTETASSDDELRFASAPPFAPSTLHRSNSTGNISDHNGKKAKKRKKAKKKDKQKLKMKILSDQVLEFKKKANEEKNINNSLIEIE